MQNCKRICSAILAAFVMSAAIDAFPLKAFAAVNTNLIKDPGMEGSKFAYSLWKCDAVLDSTVFHSGKKSLKVTKKDNFGSVKFKVDIEKGKPYYFSAWAKLGENSTKGQVIRLCIEYMLDGTQKQKILFTSPMSESDWVQVQGTYTIEEIGDISDTAVLFFSDLPPVCETYYLDDVEVKPDDGTGSSITTPTPAPTAKPTPALIPDENTNSHQGEDKVKPYAERLQEQIQQNKDGISVFIDGVPQKYDQPPMIINNRTMVPLRKIFEALGAEVTWDQNEQKVSAVKDGKAIELKIGSNTAKIDTVENTLDQAPQIVNGRTLVPVRFIGEALGKEVYWNSVTKAVNIFESGRKDIADTIGRLSNKAIVSQGDYSRLARVMRKAAAKEPITVGYIGGSITAGGGASSTDKRYGDLITKWWKQKFPQTTIEQVNAGIGATGSFLGVHRVYENLLVKEPDFVVVEFAVNDSNEASTVPYYEQLVRSILDSKNKPAVMLLFMTTKNGTNAQQMESLVGNNYSLPMISYRDAVWPEISSGIYTWEELYSADIVHPNDKGHYLISKFITDRLEDAYVFRDKFTDNTADQLAKPLVSPQMYMDGRVLTPKVISPASKDGWAANSSVGYSPDWQNNFGTGWLLNKPGTPLVFDVEGNNVGIVYRKSPDEKDGIIDVKIDDKYAGSFNANSNGVPKYPIAELVCKKLPEGKHKVEITLQEKAGQSAEFQLLALLVSKNEKDINADKPLKDAMVWDFNNEGDLQGWSVNKDVSGEKVDGGYITAQSTDRDPQLLSPESLGIDAGKCKWIRIKFKNGTTDTTAQIYFITEQDQKWDEQKSLKFKIKPNDDVYREYVVDFSDMILWSGTIKQIRIDPAAGEGSFGIDSIAVLAAS